MKTLIIVLICLLALWTFTRFFFRMKLIKDQDQDIKKLNERIHEKDKFITELIKKYGNPKEGAAFLNKMKSKLKSEK